MTTITITQNTYAKQSTAPASSLGPDKRVALKAGTKLEASVVSTTSTSHYRVTFSAPIGGRRIWMLYAGHVAIDGNTVLAVPYYSQRDNVVEWWRTCNTSSCAMAAEFLKPGSVRGSDDWYFRNCVQPEGCSTKHDVQTRALARVGIRSTFRTNLSYSDLDSELAAGRPVVIGVLHNGPLTAPTGDHILIVIGKANDNYICHDPWGAGFDYIDHNGRSVSYPKSSLDRRWLVEGPRSGWGRLFHV